MLLCWIPSRCPLQIHFLLSPPCCAPNSQFSVEGIRGLTFSPCRTPERYQTEREVGVDMTRVPPLLGPCELAVTFDQRSQTLAAFPESSFSPSSGNYSFLLLFQPRGRHNCPLNQSSLQYTYMLPSPSLIVTFPQFTSK